MIKYIFNAVKIFRPPSVFQGKRKLLKNPQCKKCVQYSQNFRGNSVFFRASASCSKILNDKMYMQHSEIRATLFFRASASCSKILNDKKYIQYSEKFLGNSVFRASGVAQKF